MLDHREAFDAPMVLHRVELLRWVGVGGGVVVGERGAKEETSLRADGTEAGLTGRDGTAGQAWAFGRSERWSSQ